jgi:D-galacturonate reductase
VEILRRFFEEAAYVEFGGPSDQRDERLRRIRSLAYNDLSADRAIVATVQALEAILLQHAAGRPGCVVRVNDSLGGLVLFAPGEKEPIVLYPNPV